MAVPTTEFTSHQTEIPGLLVFDITAVGDERGWFQEKYQRAKLVAAGMSADFTVVQTNVSYNKEKGVARGLHAEPWEKYISVVKGRAFVTYVDLRAGNNFGKVVSLEIDNNKAVFVPQGVANSYQTLEEDTYYIYSVSDHWSQELYDKYVSLNMADPELAITWPIDSKEAIVSERDRTHPMLKDIEPMQL
ncbi:dTDP-4-dehydrorhamnose 3,5-epimerase [Candidatus Saccharibacteria bacterium RIFCSPHIGHO2_12_FULL_49_19]|nr:MAG: dTDP-4-dehydrorhamnose 3,5-epimerase [Candidatus Saccharibacteria bacterium RIFCSPHIGHO2_12_FULL_49_19]